MKIRTGLALLMLWFVPGLILGIQVLKAQTAPIGTDQNESIKLTGKDIKSEDAVPKSDVIFVGEITQLGFGNLKAQGEAVYRGVQVKMSQILRGSLDPQSTFTLRVYHVYSSDESTPQTGSSYIFFVKKADALEKDPFVVLKLLPATDANIAKVKALIAAAPASQ